MSNIEKFFKGQTDGKLIVDFYQDDLNYVCLLLH